MLTTEQINDLHRLYWSDHWPIRKIERHLHMGWETIKKYLDMPAQTPAGRPRSSKLDPYKATIAELLEKDPSASAAVIGQRLRPLGFTGGGSILRQYVHEVRPQLKPQRAFVRMEPKPGERFEADWGHFEWLDYQGDQRKLYAFAQRPYQRLQRLFGSIARVIRVKECIQSARLIARYEAPVGADDAAIEIVSDRQ